MGHDLISQIPEIELDLASSPFAQVIAKRGLGARIQPRNRHFLPDFRFLTPVVASGVLLPLHNFALSPSATTLFEFALVCSGHCDAQKRPSLRSTL